LLAFHHCEGIPEKKRNEKVYFDLQYQMDAKYKAKMQVSKVTVTVTFNCLSKANSWVLMAHTLILEIWEVEIGRIKVQSQPRQTVQKTALQVLKLHVNSDLTKKKINRLSDQKIGQGCKQD
jgi:hypothetical protein